MKHLVADAVRPAGETRVWDPFIRVFHWSLVLMIAAAWSTGDFWQRAHEAAGYIALGLVAARIVWGFTGPRFARFSDFVCRPSAAFGYLRDVVAGNAKAYLGHNPAGGLMILALLATIVALGLTGWLATTAAFRGAEWLEEAHEVLANGLLALIVLHVAGVIFTSIHEGRNLTRSMFTGRKRLL
jgi:cytochrome b